MTDEEVEKIIRSNMNLQMNLAGIRGDFEAKLQRTWVGLTGEEVTWLCNTAKSHEQTWGMFVRAIETKLRSKNDSHR